MAKLPLEAQVHPDAWAEVMAIADSGSYPHVHALGQLIRHFDALFDAVEAEGRPTWIGASTKVDEFCDYIPGTARPKLYAEPFWSLEETEGVMAAFSVSESGRPVLMAAAPFNGPRGSDPRDENVAKVRVVRLARDRSGDL